MTFIYAPRVTVVARPQFVEPPHLPVKWREPGTDGERLIEFCGRLCYMSQANPAERTTAGYINHILDVQHGSVLEHAVYSLLIEGVSRSLTHELVRHRVGFSPSQLSQRFVDESAAEFVVPPAIIGSPVEDRWKQEMLDVLESYRLLSNYLYETSTATGTTRRKQAREAARSVLPNATETKIVMTGNVRAWRTMLELRCAEGADREIRRLALVVLQVLQGEAPSCFADFSVYALADGTQAAKPIWHKV